MKNLEQSQRVAESSSDTENGGFEPHDLAVQMSGDQRDKFVDELIALMRKQDASESPEES
jgi:hypothetical protein